ncbi:MAG: ABC transporter permease [Dehalococcoidales bacterium]|nr:ABC transporter permease [Dehalococcoidales bacterium]
MSIFGLAIRNIKGSAARSLTIFLCVLGIASFFVCTTLVVQGAQNSLEKGIQRLGADILVVPEGAEQKVETALLMGKPTQVWMSTDYLKKVSAVPGVARVSPQIYLQSLYGASCCAVNEMFLVVYDPATDFAVTPWLERNLHRSLTAGEVIGGSYIFVPPGEKDIKLYGIGLTLRGNLEPTGTGIDQTMFMPIETARMMAQGSLTSAVEPLVIPDDTISSIMVEVAPDADPHKVSLKMLLDVVGVTPIESPNLFGKFREQMLGLLWGFVTLLSFAWILSMVLIGLIFSMAANERRREMAVLRALGATRYFIFRSVLTEAGIIAIIAGILGIAVSSMLVYTFKDYVAGSLRMPFLFPSLSSFMGMALIGVALSLATMGLATFLPALRISRQEPAVAMRE